MADVEERLLLKWVTGLDDSSDPRLTLREALHSKLVTSDFDYVLLDCPPRVGTATINGLAATDFVVVPVVLDVVSAANPLPHLLRELARLRSRSLFPRLSLLGLIANRVQGHGKAASEAVWKHVGNARLIEGGPNVYRFETQIQQAVAFSNAAKVLFDDHETAAVVRKDRAVRETFENLAAELQERITHESRQLAAVHS